MLLPKIDLFVLSVMSLPTILNGWENQYYAYWNTIDNFDWENWNTRKGLSSDGNFDLYQENTTNWESNSTTWENLR
jgi:hypothetical protein